MVYSCLLLCAVLTHRLAVVDVSSLVMFFTALVYGLVIGVVSYILLLLLLLLRCCWFFFAVGVLLISRRCMQVRRKEKDQARESVDGSYGKRKTRADREARQSGSSRYVQRRVSTLLMSVLSSMVCVYVSLVFACVCLFLCLWLLYLSGYLRQLLRNLFLGQTEVVVMWGKLCPTLISIEKMCFFTFRAEVASPHINPIQV